jgi:hypothetical protein
MKPAWSSRQLLDSTSGFLTQSNVRVICSHSNLAGAVLILWTTDKADFYRSCGLSSVTAFKVMRKAPDWMAEGLNGLPGH